MRNEFYLSDMFQFVAAVVGCLVPLCSAASKEGTFLCGQYDKHNSSSSPFIFSTNEWGDDGSGVQCISINANNTVFNATWRWSDNPTLVHSYPNIKLDSDLLPLKLSNMSALNTTVSWSMFPQTPSDSLSDLETAANVVFDMFLDPDPAIANSTTLPKYEVMVWLAEFGGKRPIGFSSSIKSPPTVNLSGTEFMLYSGSNNNGQYVYSWMASTNISDFNEDISPLLHYLWRHKKISEDNYLGTVQFGTETFHSSSNVTFSAQDFNLSVTQGKPESSKASAFTVPGLVMIVVPAIFGLSVSV